MTFYITSNVKLSNSQLQNLKSGMRNADDATLNISLNVIGYSNDQTNIVN